MDIKDVDLTVDEVFSRGYTNLLRNNVALQSFDDITVHIPEAPEEVAIDVYENSPNYILGIEDKNREIYEAISSDYCDCCGAKITRYPYEPDTGRLCRSCYQHFNDDNFSD